MTRGRGRRSGLSSLSGLLGAGLALAAGALLAACRGVAPPDPFAVGTLPPTRRAPVRLAALYAVPPPGALLEIAALEDPSGETAALLEIAWEDAVADAVASSFARARRVPSPSALEREGGGDVVVRVALARADPGRAGRSPARVELAWSVASRGGAPLWSDAVAGEAPAAEGARGLLPALRHAALESRRRLMGQTLWRRYEPADGAPTPRSACE